MTKKKSKLPYRLAILHEALEKLKLNERQIDALLFFKEKKEIFNSDYAKRYKVTDRTARYDLIDLVRKELLVKVGEKKSTKYVFR